MTHTYIGGKDIQIENRIPEIPIIENQIKKSPLIVNDNVVYDRNSPLYGFNMVDIQKYLNLNTFKKDNINQYYTLRSGNTTLTVIKNNDNVRTNTEIYNIMDINSKIDND